MFVCGLGEYGVYEITGVLGQINLLNLLSSRINSAVCLNNFE